MKNYLGTVSIMFLFFSRIPNALPIGDAMTMGSGVCIYSTGNINFREMFKNYEKKYVKAKPDDDNDPDDPDEATEATEATTGTKITYFGLGKSTFFGRKSIFEHLCLVTRITP